MRSFVFAAFAGAVSATAMEASDYQFMRYVVDYSKEYKTVEEYNMRKDIFVALDAEIVRLNQSNLTSRHGHNKFSDYTREEYHAMLGLRNMPKPEKKGQEFKIEHVSN